MLISHKIYLHFVKKQFEARIVTIAGNLASRCYEPLLNRETGKILHVLQMFLNEEDIQMVMVVDDQRRILARELAPRTSPEPEAEELMATVAPWLQDKQTLRQINDSQEIAIYPIKSEPKETPRGFVILSFDSQGVFELTRKAEYGAILVSALVLLIGLVVLQRFSLNITRPIRELMNGTDQVSKGNLDYQIHVEDEGEFGQLARKFNEMILKLNYYNKQKSLLNRRLHEYNEKLEEKIRERTLQLKKIQEEVLLIFHQIPVGLLVVDMDGKIMWYNRELMNIVELPFDFQMENSSFTSVEQINETGLAEILEDLRKVPEKQVVQHSLSSESKHYSKMVEIAAQPLIREDAQVDGMIFIIRDITRELTMERKMIQDQRLESIGTIAGGIAHDFNNILAIILPNAQLLKLKVADNEEWVKYLDTIEKAADQAASLTRQILSFSRGASRENFEIINLSRVVADFAHMFRRVLDRKIEIKMDLAADLTNIRADYGQIEQVLMNLSVNARDAMPDGGSLTLRTRNIMPEAADEENPERELIPGRAVCLEIQDSGTGIPDEYKDKIFDPFFSSKKQGKGTGLGLSVVYGIVRSHKGIINVDSEVGQGTRVCVYFPACEEQVTREIYSDKSPEPGSGTLLIVDDEEMIQETLTAMLESLNYQVISAGNGRQAVEIYESRHEEIDAVLMDIQMPLMDGVEAAGHILKIDPQASIIFTSGYADASRFDRLKDMGYNYFLKKPYKIGILSDIIKRVMNGSMIYEK